MKSDLDKAVLKPTSRVPPKGLKSSRLHERIYDWKQNDRTVMEGDKQSGSIYIMEGDSKEGIKQFASKYAYINLKDREQLNSVRQMESELVQMTNDLLHGTAEETCGLVT